jgi:hypothetical protein
MPPFSERVSDKLILAPESNEHFNDRLASLPDDLQAISLKDKDVGLRPPLPIDRLLSIVDLACITAGLILEDSHPLYAK